MPHRVAVWGIGLSIVVSSSLVWAQPKPRTRAPLYQGHWNPKVDPNTNPTGDLVADHLYSYDLCVENMSGCSSRIDGYCGQHYYFIEVPYRDPAGILPVINEFRIRIWDPAIGWVTHPQQGKSFDILTDKPDSSVRYSLYKPGQPTEPGTATWSYTFTAAVDGEVNCCTDIDWTLTTYGSDPCCSSDKNCCDFLSGDDQYIDFVISGRDLVPGHWVLGVDTMSQLGAGTVATYGQDDISGNKIWAGSTNGNEVLETFQIYQRYITMAIDPNNPPPDPRDDPGWFNFFPHVPGGPGFHIDYYNVLGSGSTPMVVSMESLPPSWLRPWSDKLPTGGDQQKTYRQDLTVEVYPDLAGCNVTAVPDQGAYQFHKIFPMDYPASGPSMFTMWVKGWLGAGSTPVQPEMTCSAYQPVYNFYHPPDAGGQRPVKAFVAQTLRFEKGNNPPVLNQKNQYTATIYFRNPEGAKGAVHFDPEDPNEEVFFMVPSAPAGATQNYLRPRPPDTDPPYNDPNPTIGTFNDQGAPEVLLWDPSDNGTLVVEPTTCVVNGDDVSVCGNNHRVEFLIDVTWTQDDGSGGIKEVCVDHVGRGASGTQVYWSDETVPYQLPGGGMGGGGLPPLEGDGGDEAPTRASVSKVWAIASNDRAILHFNTAGEVGTSAFRVLRVGQDGELTQVGEYIPTASRPQGGAYAVEDPGLLDGAEARYIIEELDERGFQQRHGPYAVSVARTNELAPLHRGIATHPLALSDSTRERRARRIEVTAPRPLTWQTGPQRARILTRKGGLHWLSYAEIATAFGMDEAAVATAAGTANLAMLHERNPVPYHPTTGGLFFYARPLRDPTIPHRVYWLAAGEGEHMTTLERTTPTTPVTLTHFTEYVHFEQDLRARTTHTLSPDDSYWAWQYFLAGVPGQDTGTFSFELPALVSTTEPNRFVINMDTGRAADTHHLVVRVNGQQIADPTRTGIGPWSVSLDLAPGILHAGTNVLELESILDPGTAYSIMYLDSFAAAYERAYSAVDDRILVKPGNEPIVTVDGFSNDDIFVFDVSRDWDPRVIDAVRLGAGSATFEPGEIAGPFLVMTAAAAHEPLAIEIDYPSRLGAHDNSFEYLVITRRDMFPAAEELVELRRNQGLSGLVVDVQDVFDEFNDGVAHPRALRDFLSHADAHWQTPPRYVVFAGDGSYDHRNNLGNDDCVIPPAMVLSNAGSFASDTILSDVRGKDGIPEIAIGRIPVLNNDELHSYVEKVKQYEAAATMPWANYALLVADNPDEGGQFTTTVREMEPALGDELDVSTIFMEEHEIDAARGFLMNSLKTGVRVMQYTGHGGMDRLAAEGLLTIDDVPSLENAGKPTVLVTASCLVGRFGAPGVTSLAEELILAPDRGAVAVLGSVGLEYNDASSVASREILAELTGGSPRLGDAFRVGLGRAQATQVTRNTLELFTMLGDPALLVFPAPAQIIEDVGGGADSGCACDATSPAWLALLALGALGRRRRRN